MKAVLAAATGVTLLAAQEAQACRIPRTSDGDFKVAEVVVHGVLLAPDPTCRPQRSGDCGNRILTDRVIKGAAEPVVMLNSEFIIIGCSERSAELGRPATFFLSTSDGRYVVFRSEKDDR